MNHHLPSDSCTGPSCVATWHSTHTRQQNKNHLSTDFLSHHRCLSRLCFSPCLSLSYPFLSHPSLARRPSVFTCHEPCAAQGRQRFFVPVSTLAREYARFGLSHDLPKERLSGDHGKLLARVPPRLPPEPLAGGRPPATILYCARKHVTKVTSLTVHRFPSGTWVQNTSQKRCHTMSNFPSCSSLSTRHARRRGPGCLRFKTCLFYPPANCFASRPSSLMEAVCSEATSRCAPMPATHFQLYSVCVNTVEVRDANGVPSVQNAISFSCHAARTLTRFLPTTGLRVLVVLHDQQRKMGQAACPKKSLNTAAAPPP